MGTQALFSDADLFSRAAAGAARRRSISACCASAGNCAWMMRPAAAGRAPTIRAATPRTARSTGCMRSHPPSRAKSAAQAASGNFRAQCRVGSARAQTGNDRLLGQHHAAPGRAQPAPASAVERQRHLLRAGATRRARASNSKIRGSTSSWRRRRARLHAVRTNRQWVTLAASAGQVVLFESWLRHEVTPNTRRQERVSISFNFNWF